MERLPVYSFFDPGSHFMGWAVGDGSRLPTVGTFSFVRTGDGYGRMMHQVAAAVGAHLDSYQPSEVAYEEPILIFNQRFKDAQGVWRKRNDNLTTLRKTIPIGARVEELCYDRDIPCHETSVASVKKELAGFRTAEKSEMVVAARKLGVTLPDGPAEEDAADALGGWLLLLRLRNRALSAKFDQALWGGRANALI